MTSASTKKEEWTGKLSRTKARKMAHARAFSLTPRRRKAIARAAAAARWQPKTEEETTE